LFIYAFAALLLIFALALVIHAAAFLLTNTAEVYQIYNPFETPLSYWFVVAYLIDQTAKGAFFDVMEVFKIDLQSRLHLDARTHWFFGSLIAGWRFFISVSVLGTFLYLARRVWRIRRPRLRPGFQGALD
jgi:hypothetical protein